MLAKRKATKRSAIAAHSSALASTISASPVAVRGGKSGRPMTRADALDVSGEQDRAAMIRAIGDHVNTRLLNLHADSRSGHGDANENDDIDDALLHEEKKYQLMEEARLAAGTQQRTVASHMKGYYDSTKSGEGAGMALVRVKHNSNAITAVAALGFDVLVLGDKSGKVYMVDLNPLPDAPSLFASQRSEESDHQHNPQRKKSKKEEGSSASASHIDLTAYQRKRKIMLEPALPRAVVSLAISDTRANRPTTRDLFEKSSVDHSCLSYTVAGAEDGSIAVWETFSQKHKGLLFMHHKAVAGLCFRVGTADLYSASDDGTLRVWSVPQMLSLDKLFGHEGKILDLHALKRETCVTVGDDGTMRFWKVDAATQQSYTYTTAHREEALAAAVAKGEIVLARGEDSGADALSAAATETATGSSRGVVVRLECVTMVNESTVLCGAVDGSLVLFDVGRRRPLAVVPAAHGFDSLQDGTGLEKAAVRAHREQRAEEAEAADAADAAVRALLNSTASVPAAEHRPPRVFDRKRIPNIVSAVGAVPYADVVASASYDGVVRLWHVRGIGAGSAGAGHRTPLAGTAGREEEGQTPPGLALLAELPVHALVTSLQFSTDGDCLYVACSKECRRGRWAVCKAAQNGVAVFPLTAGGAARLLRLSSPHGATGGSVFSVEHVPAQLYHLQEEEGEEGEEEEGGEAEEEEEEGEEEHELGALEEDLLSGSGGALFTVGKDGQLMLPSRPPAPAPARRGDVMKAAEGRARRKATKAPRDPKSGVGRAKKGFSSPSESAEGGATSPRPLHKEERKRLPAGEPLKNAKRKELVKKKKAAK